MKKFLTYLLLLCAMIMNIYLIFYWQPIDNNDEKKVSKEVTAYSKSLYKVNKDEALNELTDADKKDLDTIIYKLSAFDIGKIKNYSQDYDEEEGVINTFKLLKTRLSGKDYKRVKDICSMFLDIEELEKQL